MRIGSAFYILFAQVFFTVALTPLLLWPALAKRRFVRSFIAWSFGKVLSGRYHRIIRSFGEQYGAALEAGVTAAIRYAGVDLNEILDCGTGTGFAACAVARRLPAARLTGIDLVPEMLALAEANARAAGLNIKIEVGDLAELPLASGTFDLVVAQNTVPFLAEFARVCRPGGVVVFVDTAARWIAPLAGLAARRTACFDIVESKRAGLGFYLVGRRKGVEQAEIADSELGHAPSLDKTA
jgi:SAM-dependent methyltransferase